MNSTGKLLHQRELLHQKNMRKKWNCFTRFSIYQEPAGGGRRDVFAEQYDVRPKFENYQNNVILHQRQKCFPCNMCDWSQNGQQAQCPVTGNDISASDLKKVTASKQCTTSKWHEMKKLKNIILSLIQLRKPTQCWHPLTDERHQVIEKTDIQ